MSSLALSLLLVNGMHDLLVWALTCFRDLDKDGQVEPKDLPKLCKSLGETWSYEVVMGAFRESKPVNPSQVSTDEFLSVPQDSA